MKIKIVADSSANMLTLDGVDFESAPLKISTTERDFTDNASLDVEEMANYMMSYKGKSGSYNAAMTAKQQYEEENPGKKVFVLDSFSAGPEMRLHVEKLRDLILEGKDFDTVCKEIVEYKEKHTALIFCLESLNNLANNGRVSHAVAKLASLIGLRLIGDVDENGLHPTDKARGEKKSTACNFSNMKRLGYNGGKLIIDHCLNEKAANALKDMTLAEFPDAEVVVAKTRGLCTYYAEKGGLMIGFEVN